MMTGLDFLKAVSDRLHEPHQEALELLPTIIVLACMDVWPIAGAGLGVMSDLRLPIGSTDDAACFVEQLQFSTGTGPCLTAVETDEPLVADEDLIAHNWPVFHHDMIARTPYRSTMSLPVSIAGYTGALDLYSTDPSAANFPSVDEAVSALTGPIRELTAEPATSLDRLGVELPVWMLVPTLDVRLDVWVAAGIIMQRSGYTSIDALATLRGFAHSQSRTLDDVSSELIQHGLTAAEIVGY